MIIKKQYSKSQELKIFFNEYRKKYYEPLCGIYSKKCLPFVEDKLKNNELSIRSFFNEVKFKKIKWENGRKLDDKSLVFHNINTHEDLKKAVEYYEQKK